MSSDTFDHEAEAYEEMPDYELEDNGCRCTEDGVSSEWEWNKKQGCWICTGCGAVQ